MKAVGVCVVGLGHNGRAWCDVYARNPGYRLLAVCDKDARRLKDAAQAHGAEGYRDYSFLDRGDLEAVSIHTPDHLHAEPFIAALKAGKHVVVEKPLANSLADLRKMVRAADRSGRVVMVAQVLRFYPIFQTAKAWIDQGMLGEIFYMEADYIHDLRYQRRMEKWKVTQELPIVGGGVHPLDLLRWFNGEITQVYALGNHISYREMRNDTAMAALFRFKNGAIAKVTALYGCVNPMPALYNLGVYGTKGTLLRDQLCLDGLHEWMKVSAPAGKSYEAEAEHFLDCIRTGKTPLVTAHDGARSAAACLCAVQSAALGRPVRVPAM
jgi:UDP-N-acetylglucosamine 3-dehydrogenase